MPILAQAAGIWLATRVALMVFTYFAVSLGRVPISGSATLSPVQPLEIWKQYDGVWYVEIAAHGYSSTLYGFFPLYPALIHVLGVAIGGHYFLAAGLLSNVFTLVGFAGFGLLVNRESCGGLEVSGRAVAIVAAYPLAFFLFAPFTEAPFFAFATLSLYGARTSRWPFAATMAALASLTRPTGVILLLPLAWEFWRQRRSRALTFRLLLDGLMTLGAVPVGLLTYMAYTYNRTGDALLWLHLQRSTWHHTFQLPWQIARGQLHLIRHTNMFDPVMGLEWIDLGFFLVFGVLTLVTARRQPFAFTLYMVGLLYLTVAAPVPYWDFIPSTGRYLSAAVPVFLFLGQLARIRSVEVGLVSCGFMIQSVLALRYLSGGWVG